MATASPRNEPRPPPKLNPNRPRSEEVVEHPLEAIIRAAVEQYGRPTAAPTRSRRHGAAPLAGEHVRRYLLSRLGVPLAALAFQAGRSAATIAESVQRGRRLVQEGAEARGFLHPDGRLLIRDPESDLGFSDPDEPGE